MYHSLCDIYVEASKTVLNDPSHPDFEETLSTLYVAVTTGLKLMHPLMPFITEELYQRIQVEFLGGHIKAAHSIMQETFPEYHNEVDLVFFVLMGHDAAAQHRAVPCRAITHSKQF